MVSLRKAAGSEFKDGLDTTQAFELEYLRQVLARGDTFIVTTRGRARREKSFGFKLKPGTLTNDKVEAQHVTTAGMTLGESQRCAVVLRRGQLGQITVALNPPVKRPSWGHVGVGDIVSRHPLPSSLVRFFYS